PFPSFPALADVQPPHPRLLGRYRCRRRGLPRAVPGVPRACAQRVVARDGARPGTHAPRARPGVRGARDATGFPRAGAAGRPACRQHRPARMPQGQPGVRAGSAPRRSAAGVRDGADRSAGGIHLPAAPVAGSAVRRTHGPGGTRLMQPIEPAAAQDGINMLALVLHASIPVQLVMLLLLFGSVASWVIIFRKKRVLDRAEDEADRFEERFWSGAELSKLYAGATERTRDVEGLEAIFEGGFREFHRVGQRRGGDGRMQLEAAQRAMRAAASRELDGLERNLEFLANVGSIAPYVGLFGTVWGIMVSFQGLANVKEATIATVAPGIAERLIATAMALFAALPAVWAYNRYATRVERMSVRYDTFSEEFSAILQRQAHVDGA